MVKYRLNQVIRKLIIRGCKFISVDSERVARGESGGLGSKPSSTNESLGVDNDANTVGESDGKKTDLSVR